MEDWKQIKECMEDAGCSASAIRRAEGFCRAGASGELLRCLRACRCEALEELHERQKRLDRLDGLIRRTQQGI